MGVLENDINRMTQSDDGDRQAEAERKRMDVGKDMEKKLIGDDKEEEEEI